MTSEQIAADRRVFVEHLLAEKRMLERALTAVDAAIHIYTTALAVEAPPPIVAPEAPEVAEVAEPVRPPLAEPQPGLVRPDPGFGIGIEGRYFYPARLDIIRREWPRGTPVGEVTAMLNEMPGKAVDNTRVSLQATKLGVRRPGPSHPAASPFRPPPTPPTPPPPPIPPSIHGEGVLVNFEQVRRWAAERGIQFTTWDDLPKVNRKREALGQGTFKRDFMRPH